MTLTREAISFVLELQFNEISEYEQFLLYEHNRCEYTDKYNIVYKNYDIFVTIDEKLTRFYYQEKLPYQFGMLCENKESLMIRYVYYSSHGLYDKFNDVFSNTNCEW